MSEKEDKKKFYITVAYPYPSGAMHVGHGRTYTVPDVIARYKRMKSYDVLFPMAFHVTGAPVIGISKRIARGDEEAIKLYRDVYGVPEDTLKKFSDPLEIVSYFTREYKEIMNMMGYCIDWSREFTTIDPHYKKFIEWQFHHLMKKGFISKGEHPIRYCPSCENPVGDHDLLSGEDARLNEFVLIKFALLDSDILLPTATLRPETVFGVTNIWINPDADYVIAAVRHPSIENEERWLISEKAAESLRYQRYEIQIKERHKGSDFLDREVLNVVDNRRVKILPAGFVDPEMGTGVVMSVPAHAPFDFVALRDLHKKGKYTEIQPIKIIETEGYGEIPAETIVSQRGISSQEDEKLEDVTDELYADEFNRGVMQLHEDPLQLDGRPVREARDIVKDTFLKEGKASLMYEFSRRPVICRCNSPIHISIVSDQWFLNYQDKKWKEEVKNCLSGVDIVPAEIRADFLQVIDWLREWACARRIGLGTELPWDKKWIIEPLSDSTIYMAYYTISDRIKDLPLDACSYEIFDYIFLGIPLTDEKKKELSTRELEIIEKMRSSFLYWYPYDYRFSAKDLVGNHLTFQLFHHVAIFPKEFFPRGIVVFGMATKDGKKMSSSKGNVLLLKDAIMRYGADAVRMFLMGAAEPWQDFDWRDELVLSVKRQIERFSSFAHEVMEGEGKEEEERNIDRWLMSRLQEHIREVNDALDSFQCRRALQHAYYEIEKDLRWYRRRAFPERKATLRELVDVWVRLLSPFIPYTCEEIRSKMREKGYPVSDEFPEPDESLLDVEAELMEDLLKGVYDDIVEILKVIKVKPSTIMLCFPPEWKKEVFYSVFEGMKKGMKLNEIMKDIMKGEEIRKHGKEAAEFVRKAMNRIKEKSLDKYDRQLIHNMISREKDFLSMEKSFFEREFGCSLEVYDAMRVDEIPEDLRKKTDAAIPTRPAILIS